MRIIELIESVREYNELMVKHLKGKIWLDNPNISKLSKEKFTPKWEEMLKEVDKKLRVFKEMGITFDDCEMIEVIELPDQLKRPEIEGFLESYYKMKKFDNKTKDYSESEREGIKLF